MSVLTHRAGALVLALSCSLAAHVSNAAGQGDESQVLAVLDRESAAFRKGDLAGVTACWETEPTSSVFESGYANWGWADYRDNHLSKELAGMKISEASRKNVHVLVGGEMALATFEFHLKGVYEGRAFYMTGLESAVLRRREGAWRIVHVHASTPPRK